MIPKNRTLLLLAVLLTGANAGAHEGDSESRAFRMQALLGQMEKQLDGANRETDPQKRKAALNAHRALMMQALSLLREGADRSACVMLEGHREDQKLACLIDTEARLRATDRLLEQMLQRETLRAD